MELYNFEIVSHTQEEQYIIVATNDGCYEMQWENEKKVEKEMHF